MNAHFVKTLMVGATLVFASAASAASAEPASDPIGLAAQISVESAQQAARSGNFREAARGYLEASRLTPEPSKWDYVLLAAEAKLAEGKPLEVEGILRRIPPTSVDRTRAQLADILRAKARRAQGDYAGARASLPTQFEPGAAVIGWGLAAELAFAQADVLGNLAARLQRNEFLELTGRASNEELLWSELSNAATENLGNALKSAPTPLAKGWIELALIARAGGDPNLVENWRNEHLDHPGIARIGTLMTATSATGRISANGRLGVLIPLTGPLAPVGKAIRLGIESASARLGSNAPELGFYDTQLGIDSALAAAKLEGATAYIGPIKKEDLNSVLRSDLSAPMLALNYPDQPSNISGSNPIIAFGLSPEDEARAAGEEAALNGLSRAVIFAAEGDWGERSAKAFAETFVELGGTVVAFGHFKPDAVDYRPQLRTLLGIPAPGTEPTPTPVGAPTSTEEPAVPGKEPDVFFLASKARQARLIWPQLQFLRTTYMETYATAAAIDAGPAELKGLKICDAPWLNVSSGEVADLRTSLAGVNPKGPDTQRFFALGYDAFDLALRASQNSLKPGIIAPGLTGELALNDRAEIHRKPLCMVVNSNRSGPAIFSSPPPSPSILPTAAGNVTAAGNAAPVAKAPTSTIPSTPVSPTRPAPKPPQPAVKPHPETSAAQP